MRKYYTLILTIFFTLCISPQNLSANEPEGSAQPLSHGLAMHGNPKYSTKNTHLDYANPDAPKGGHLKMGAIGTFDSLNPYTIKGQAPENMNLFYDRLMRRVWDEPFTMYPLIAEKVELSDDRSEITFHLNPNAKFHDGSQITTEDVEFSFNALKEFGRPNMRRIYALVDKMEIKSPTEIYFHFGEGYDRETPLILAMMPILSKKWWEAREFNSTITEIPLSNGPYKIKEFETGRKITYERVKDYWAQDLLANKGQYNFDTITYDYYRDDTIALESFKKGDLNLRREWDIGKWQSAYSDLSETMIKNEAAHQRPERAHGFIFNMRREPFDNVEVRQALSMAFDDNWALQNIYHNQFKRISSVFPNSALAAPDNNVNPQDQNLRNRLKIADNLLQKNGWIVQNGKRVNKETGKPLSFEIILSTPQEEKIALSYQKTLQRLGITLNIRVLDSATFQNRKQNYDYDMISFYWQNSLSPGTEQMLYWSCAAANEQARFNFSGICDPKLDELSQNIANAQSYDELTNIAHQIDQILMEQTIMIPLFYKGTDYIAHNKNIKHPDTTPIYGAVLETWWMNPQSN